MVKCIWNIKGDHEDNLKPSCDYNCAMEHDCKVEVEDEFFTLLKESFKENKDLMQILSKR